MWQSCEEVIRAELSPNEQLLWSGQPAQGIRLRSYDWFLIPFSLLWGGFAIVWESFAIMIAFSAAAKEPVVFIFPLFGIPFVLIGLYIIFGRFIVDAKQRARTFYGLTSERIIMVSGVWRRTVKSLNLETLNDISLTEKRNGGGIIMFGQIPWLFALWESSGGFPGMPQFGGRTFELSDDVRQIYEKIREAQRTALQRRQTPATKDRLSNEPECG